MLNRSARTKSRLGRVRAAVGWAISFGLISTITPSIQPAVQADTDVCWLDGEGTLSCPGFTSPAEPASQSLLTPRAYETMTADQEAAMRRLESQAVSTALQLYQLPAADAPYLEAWARADVTGLLQKLVMKAVETLPNARTSDEKLVAAWLGERIQERNRRARFQEGEEYARWAGLDVDRYWSLVNGGASKAVLTDFFSRTPVDMNGSTRETSTGGYCVYHPPAGFTDYDPNTLQICHQPCQSSFSCLPQPTVEQFVAWGAARARAYDRVRDPMFAVGAAQVTAAASGAGFIAGEVSVGKTLSVDLYKQILNRLNPEKIVTEALEKAAAANLDKVTALGEAFDGLDSAFVDELQRTVKLVFERNVAADLRMAIRGQSWFGTIGKTLSFQTAEELGRRISEVTERLIQEIGDKVARLAQTISKVAGGWAADMLIFSITALIDASFILDAIEKRPGQIAGHVVYARDVPLDPYGWALQPGGRDIVRFEFMNAVAPTPAVTPLRPATAGDPRFLIRGTEDGSMVQSSTLALGRVVEDRWTPVTVRVSGRWAVEKWWHAEHGLDMQSLELRYTNHELQPEVAWLVPQADGDYSFFVVSPGKAGFNRDTCRADGTCWESEELRYLDADGNPRVARLEAFRPPTGAPVATPAVAKAGQAVTFTGNTFAPGGHEGALRFAWRFQREGCGIAGCLTYQDGRTYPSYTAPVSGYAVTHTWTIPGTYQAEVTVTDARGRTATTALTVTVSG